VSSHDRGRLEEDAGAVIPELALALPLLLALVLGLLEFGIAWRNAQQLAVALRTTVRTGAQAQDAPQADRLMLEALLASQGSYKNMQIQKVIIYRVDITSNPSGTVPNSCRTASTSGSPPYGVNGVCNVYVPSQLTSANLVASNFGGTTTSGCTRYDCRFRTNTREKSLAAAGGPTYFGVWVQYRYTYLTKLLPGDGMTIDDQSVGRIEPVSP
jgi:Flp pilus assembly protein TadG